MFLVWLNSISKRTARLVGRFERVDEVEREWRGAVAFDLFHFAALYIINLKSIHR